MTGVVTVLTLVVAIGLPAMGAAADDDDGGSSFTFVAMWRADRAHWGDLVAMYAKYDKPIMEKLYADGVITGWGIGASQHSRLVDAQHRPEPVVSLPPCSPAPSARGTRSWYPFPEPRILSGSRQRQLQRQRQVQRQSQRRRRYPCPAARPPSSASWIPDFLVGRRSRRWR